MADLTDFVHSTKDPKQKDIARPIFPCYAAASYLHVPLANCSLLTKHCEGTGF